jgi:hypothetical protein
MVARKIILSPVHLLTTIRAHNPKFLQLAETPFTYNYFSTELGYLIELLGENTSKLRELLSII